MTETAFNSILIFVFIVIGGVFRREMASVSLRGSQIRQPSRRRRHRRLVGSLHANRSRLLSAV
ncbi:MAG TPA: hypothetical protein VFT17_12215 [Propionibacteriaceae bacterium]|nr:hypothetical protein [Propionibacteriaceae bacterium]